MNRKILFFAAISVFLELYDFTLYTVVISLISPLFFKFENPSNSILMGYLTISAAFLFNPIGAIYWGWMGDKYGRVRMLKKAMIFMAIPSLGISLLPTYAEIGLLAPILLFSLRIFQNFSISGGNLGSKILALENAGLKTGLVAGIMSFSGGMGVVLASLSGYLISMYSQYENLWRIPFFIGSILMIIRVIITKSIFRKHSITAPEIKFTDLSSLISEHKNSALMVFSFGAIIAGIAYTISSFLHSYYIQIGYDKTISYLFVAISTVIVGISSIITGIMIDKSGNPKNMLIKSLIYFICFSMPAFMLISSGNIYLAFLGTALLGTLHGINCASCNVLMYQAFPRESRCRGVTLCYSIGAAIFGGSAPFLLKAVSIFHILAPGVIVTIFVILILIINLKCDYDSLYRYR